MSVLRIMPRVFAALACLGIAGCAAVDVRRVAEANQPGVRYWRPAPYLALQPTTANGATTCEAKVVMLPDKQEEYAITMNSGLWGSVQANPALSDGWNLTSLDGKADSKTAETLTALASVIKAVPLGATAQIASINKGKPQPSGTLVPKCGGLYRAHYDPETHMLVEFKEVKLPVNFIVATPQPPQGDKPDPKKCGKPGQPACTE
jgi:hypothetical protein